MVKAVVVKSAGGGAGKSMSCEAICAQFDPPIKFGSHAELVGSLDGFQAEHIVPTSAFHKSGRGGKKVKGCEGYSTSGATTWMVRDGQKAGQEHKRLTDPMRQFSQMKDLAGEEAPLKDWLKEYEKGAKDALKKAKPQRKIKDKKLDRNSLIDAAAKCIRSAAAESFDKMDPKVSQDTMLRNPWKATKEQKAEAAAAAQQVGKKRKR
ncbi:hypothetical protein A4W93_12585 [Piscinibacter gummiphilus]|uniref:Uncharacterized protein n=2 Tax=Piscinibacter gummiphilus TaxID=946333 RepID=A0A1W6L8Y0_9BURK|nr:hypothetical protein A4W93_12585 [Piscinibacter gummiphilus]ATU65341.1 hypothetical protein CPZ87_12665 [Piscinibacter gummiphilus]GLS94485.1 hypothetical protein GCM10007918_17770 [Piscinibacter gummiphilus]